jgi:hypothetical protein
MSVESPDRYTIGVDVGTLSGRAAVVRFAVGIATDFTACTMVPARSDGTPLNELEELRSRPHAYAARPAGIKRRAAGDGTSGPPAGFGDPDAEATS